MKTIKLPAGTENVQFDQIALLIADALHPVPEVVNESHMGLALRYGMTRDMLEKDLKQAAASGLITLRIPGTYRPYHEPPIGPFLELCLVTVADLQKFALLSGVAVSTAPAPNAQAAPVVAEPTLILTPARRNETNYNRCKELGLDMPTMLNSGGGVNMPRGLSKAAEKMGMKSQSLRESVTKHIEKISTNSR